MLHCACMKTTLVATALALGISGSAMAGGFVGIGLGSPSVVQDDTGRFSSAGRSERLMGGYAFPVAYGKLALEGAYTSAGANRQVNNVALPLDGAILWAAGRYNFPMGNGFEVFGRIGAQYTSLSSTVANRPFQADGKGPVVGAGFEFHPQFKLGVDLSIWVDVTYASTHLTSAQIQIPSDSSDHLYTLGVTAGF